MGRNLRSWWGLGVATVLALQPVQAGDRKSAAGREQRVAAHQLALPTRAGLSADSHMRISKVNRPGEVPFSPVRPLEVRLVPASYKASASDDGQSAKRSTPRRERKGLTLFRVNPKFGDISVQPVIGGVNGAQISVGF
jgi:hypothetical protein